MSVRVDMITLDEYTKICERLGFKVYHEDIFNRIYFKNQRNIGLILADYVLYCDGTYEVQINDPVNYTVLSPGTSCNASKYTDPNEFQLELMKAYFTMKKYQFSYDEKLNVDKI